MSVPDKRVLIARIRAAADAGLISAVDRDIRIGNVERAGSDAELDLIARELDQANAPSVRAVAKESVKPRSRVGVIVTGALLVVAVLAIIVGALSGAEWSTGGSSDGEIVQGDDGSAFGGWSDEGDGDWVDEDDDWSDDGGDGWYGTSQLDADTLQMFMDAYLAEFGAMQVRRVVLTNESAAVWVVNGPDDVAKWRYAEEGWELTDESADLPAGNRAFDVTDFDVVALGVRIGEAVDESVDQDADAVVVTFRFLRSDPGPVAVIDAQDDQTDPMVVTTDGKVVVHSGTP